MCLMNGTTERQNKSHIPILVALAYFNVVAGGLAACGQQDTHNGADETRNVIAGDMKPVADAERSHLYAFPTGITELLLPVQVAPSSTEIIVDYSGGLIPRVGDEAVLETRVTNTWKQVGFARVFRVTDEHIVLRRLGGNLPAATNVRILANPIHRCDLIAASPLDGHAVVTGTDFSEIGIEAIGYCEQAVGKYPDTPRFQFQLGRALDAHQQEKAAIARYRRTLALAPHYAPAMLALGGKYMNGEGVDADSGEAIRFLQQARELGQPRASYLLARIAEQGAADMPPDSRQALAYYTEAGHLGDLPSQLYLANAYQTGEGVEQNFEHALYWHEMAAEQGHLDSQYLTGRAYADGHAREPSWSKARQWWDWAANQGHVRAQVALGELHEAGHGLEGPEPEMALYWYRQAAEQDDAMGQYHVGRMYAEGIGVQKNMETARKWLLLARAQGVHEANRWLAPEKPPVLVSFDTFEVPAENAAEDSEEAAQIPETRHQGLGNLMRWQVQMQGYMDADCSEMLVEELEDLDIQVVGPSALPQAKLIVTMSNPEYYSNPVGPFTFEGYNTYYRAEVIRSHDLMRLFYTHGEEDGDDQNEACEDAVDEIIDELEDDLDD